MGGPAFFAKKKGLRISHALPTRGEGWGAGGSRHGRAGGRFTDVNGAFVVSIGFRRFQVYKCNGISHL